MRSTASQVARSGNRQSVGIRRREKPCRVKKRSAATRVVVRDVGAHPVAVGRSGGVEVDDRERAAGPQHPPRLGQPGFAALAEEVRRAGVDEVDRRVGDREPRSLPLHHRQPVGLCALHQRGVGLDTEHRPSAVEEAQVEAVAAADVEHVAIGPRHLVAQRGPHRTLDVLRGVLLRVDLGPVPDVGARDAHASLCDR